MAENALPLASSHPVAKGAVCWWMSFVEMKILVPFIHLIVSFALLLSGVLLDYGIEIHLGAFVVLWCGGLVAMRYIWPTLHEDGPSEVGFYPMLATVAFSVSFIYWLHPLGFFALCLTLVSFVVFYPLKRWKRPSKQPQSR